MSEQADFLKQAHRLQETESQKMIRAFAEGGKTLQAKTFFKQELLNALRKAGGNANDLDVQKLATFGTQLFGETEVEPIFADCVNAVVGELELRFSRSGHS